MEAVTDVFHPGAQPHEGQWASATMIGSWPTLSEVAGIYLKFKEQKK